MFDNVEVDRVLFVIWQETIFAVSVLLFPQHINLIHFEFPEIYISGQLEPLGNYEVKGIGIHNSAFASRHGRFIKDFPAGRFAGFFPGPGFALVKIRRVGETSHMPMTLDQIVEETREMPGEVVAELIDRIMVARHGGMEPSVAESWKTETDRRIAEIESGKVKGVTPEENAARIQNILRR